MSFHRLKYLLVYIIPVLVLFSISSPNIWAYSALIFTFGVIPLFELFFNGNTKNLSKAEEAVVKEDKLYDYMLYALVPIQYGTMVYFLFQIGDTSLPLYVKVGMTAAFGISCGVFGINAAHELGHRSTWYEQLMSKMLLLTSLYMHFFIEHNRGHHKNVSTDDDPASSRYDEIVYTFYFRSIIGGWLSAWHLEGARLKAKKQGFWSIHNEMLRFQVIQVALIVAIGLVFSGTVLLFFLASATIGFLLLETVNYIEHYGLRRKKKGNSYERTLPIHSWNSNHPLGRLLLLELSRHSDHHYIANRKYQTLRHFDESPQMPTGYPGMVLLSLFPPLWFMVMHKQINKYKGIEKGVALA
ncbi:MAG: alkane 1-monooxygenase [Aureispira sp.]|nr:alkane 1-monooxygenase [Aureispira sp.]